MTAGIESGVTKLLFPAGRRDTALEWQNVASFEPLFEEGLTILSQSQEVGQHRPSWAAFMCLSTDGQQQHCPHVLPCWSLWCCPDMKSLWQCRLDVSAEFLQQRICMLQRSSATDLVMLSLMPLTGKSFLPRIW